MNTIKSKKKILIFGVIIFSLVVFGAALIVYQIYLTPPINTDNPAPDNSSIQEEPFVNMARNFTSCSEKRNELFIINESLVFWAVEGNCSDASYRYSLFGRTPSNILCSLSDSIAGPRFECTNESYRGLFQTITSHLDDENLGLGSEYQVRQITF